MPIPPGSARRPVRALVRTVAIAYVVAFAMLPFAHHDLLCHLKSSTHCTVCHLSTSGDDSAEGASVASVTLVPAGVAADSQRLVAGHCRVVPDIGRAPPSSDFLS